MSPSITLKGKSLLRDQLYQKIRDMIDNEKLRPGDKLLPERELSQRFGVNHQTLRSTLKILELEGFIERHRGSGTYICEHSGSENSANLVGLLVQTEGHTYSDFSQELCKGLQKSDLNPIVLSLDELTNASDIQKHVNDLLSYGCEKIIIQGLISNSMILDVKHITTKFKSIVWVLCEPTLSPDVPGHFVGSDRNDGIFQCVEHLIKMGHKRIAYFSHGAYQKERPSFKRSLSLVMDTFKIAMETYGSPGTVDYILGSLDQDYSEKAIENVLLSEQKPTAIVSSSDYRSVSVINVAQRLNIKIPEELSVIGFDNTPWANAYEMTSVALDIQSIVAEAIELLNMPQTKTKNRHVVKVKPHLIVRNTSGPARNGQTI